MPWSGGNFSQVVGPSPIFTGPTVWEQDAAAGILIESERHDYHDQDLADGIDACLNKNGANSPTANIDWANHKITSLSYGSGNNDAGAYGQIPISATLDPTTNIVTFSRPDGNIFTVDLTALVIGGSTANFALLNADNAFTGVNSFADTISATTRITLNSTTLGESWRYDSPSFGLNTIAPNDGGCVFNFFNDGSYGAAGGALTIGGFRVWDQSQLTQAQLDSFLTRTASYNITSSWTFSNSPLIVPATLTQGASLFNGSYTIQNATTWQMAMSGGTAIKFTSDASYNTQLLIGGTRVAWHSGNLRSDSVLAPTGGHDNDLAVVPTGADRGLWQNLAGTWTKLIAFP